jgi:hypothetical protein
MGKISNRSAFIPDDPEMLDYVCVEIRERLLEKLLWIDEGYLLAEMRVRQNSIGEVSYPGVLNGGMEYLSMFPDTHLGNYFYFINDDPLEIEYGVTVSKIVNEIGLVVFFDYRSVWSSGWEEKSIQNMMRVFLDFFQTEFFSRSRVRPLRFRTSAGDIYEGFDSQEIKRQFLMKPFGALRIDLELSYYPKC